MKAVKRTAGAILALLLVMNPVIIKSIEDGLAWKQIALLSFAYAGAGAFVIGLLWLTGWLLLSGD
jgi:hypothetical protein